MEVSNIMEADVKLTERIKKTCGAMSMTLNNDPSVQRMKLQHKNNS